LPAKKEASLVRDVFGVKILSNSHPEIKKLRKETGYPSIHGNKFWKSTYLLMDYLREFPPVRLKAKRGKRHLKVLEVGCGWGLGGIFCAKEFSADLTALDADPVVFPYLEHHAILNEVDVTTWCCRYEQVKKADLDSFQDMAEKAVDKLGATYENWSVPHPHNSSGYVMDYDPNYYAE